MKTDIQTPRERVYFIILVGLSLLIVGMTSNHQVIKYNNGDMPVYTFEEYWIVDDGHHFLFDDFDDVNYPYLSDIFRIGDRFASIGDIVMLNGLAVLSFALGVALRDVRNKKKDKHKRNKGFPYKRRALRKQKKDE